MGTPSRLPAPRALLGRTVGILGLGLIGGSVFKRLSRHRPRLRVLGFDRDAGLAGAVRPYGRWCASLDDLVAASDVLVLCVPVPEIVKLLPRIARLARARRRRGRLLVTDMGSMKRPVERAAARWRADIDYVGMHPLAGGERNGWAAASGALFRGRVIVYCPAGARQDRVARELARLLGGVPVPMAAAAHDRMAAETIGLPHLVAFAASGLRPPAHAPHPLRGTSWGSLTRVSVSDPAFVAGLLQPNAAHQRRVVRAFVRRLLALSALVSHPTTGPLTRALQRAGRGR